MARDLFTVAVCAATVLTTFLTLVSLGVIVLVGTPSRWTAAVDSLQDVLTADWSIWVRNNDRLSMTTPHSLLLHTALA